MIATCHTRSPAEYCDALLEIDERFGKTVAGADPAARVPTCPDWSLDELVTHVGRVHRWATLIVSTRAQERPPREKLNFGSPAGSDDYARWLTEGVRGFAGAVAAADTDGEVWAWGADKHVRFWPRRMVHETAIHAVDGALAVGSSWEPEPEVAVDGIDEFLDNLPHASSWAPQVQQLRSAGESIGLRALEHLAWTITLEPERFSWRHAVTPADVTVAGSASDLYRFLWGRVRADELEVTGRRELLDRWTSNSAL